MGIFSRVGSNIKLVRNRNKITQEKLAEMIGMDVRSVGSIESGQRNPTMRTLYKICKALGVSSSDLLPF